MVRKSMIPLLLVMVVCVASQAVSGMMPVSQHYLTDEYMTIRAFHKQIEQMIKQNPQDQALKNYALRVTQTDLAAVQNLDPPEQFIEMKDFMVNGLRQHVAALQLYLKGNTKAAEKRWKRGNAQFQWVDEFLAERDWTIENPPMLDPDYKFTDIPLTPAQYADRYFLLRMLNDPDLNTKAAGTRKDDSSLDRLERRLTSEQRIWTEQSYPDKMKAIHDQVGQLIQLSQDWVKMVRAGQMDQAGAQEAKIDDLCKKINGALAQQFKIAIPAYVQNPPS